MALTTVSQHVVSVNAIQGTLIADNAITAVHIATNAVSGTLIADNAVTATHIAQNTITVTQLADDAVEADKIADGVITTNHLNKAMISSQTEVTPVAGDFVLIGDTSDSNNLKKTPISGITALATVSGISSSADATAITISSSEVVTFSKPTTSDGHTSSAATIFEANANGDTVPVQLKVKANNGTTSTQGLYGNAGSASTDNTIVLGNSGTSGICVLSSGKAIIGDIASHVDDLLQIETPASGGGHGIQIRRNDSNNDQGIGRIMFGNNTDTDLATIQATTDGSTDNARLAFFTQPNGGSSTERVRIDGDNGTIYASQDLGVHTNVTSYAHSTYDHVAVFGGNSVPDGVMVIEDYDVSSGIGNTVLKCYLRDQDPATNAVFIDFSDGGGRVGSIIHNDDGGGVTYNTTSDYRLKENVEYNWDATTLLKQLKPAKFNFKRAPGRTVQGMLAHEVSDIVPYSVKGEKDHMMEIGTIKDSNENIVYEGVYEHFCKTDEGQTWTKTGTEPRYQELDYSRLVPLLVKTIQELEARIATLEE